MQPTKLQEILHPFLSAYLSDTYGEGGFQGEQKRSRIFFLFLYVAFCYLNVPDDTLFFRQQFADHKKTKCSLQLEPVKQPKWLRLDISADNKWKEVEYK